MTHMRILLAAAALGAAWMALPAAAAPLAPQLALVEAEKAVSPMADVRHKKKLRKHKRHSERFHHRRHKHRHRRIASYGYYGDWYDQPSYYHSRRHYRRHHRQAYVVHGWCPPYDGYCNGYYYAPRPRIGFWLYSD